MTELLPGTQHILTALLARDQVAGRVPGMVAGVVSGVGGWLAWSAAAGDVPSPHQDVQYRLGSITKTITAIAVLRLRDEGRLALGDVLDDHLPGTPLGSRTISQLLSHLGGIRSEMPGQWWERTPGTTLQDLRPEDDPEVLPPGRRFHYSNTGFGLLGELVARARGAAWIDVVTDEILRPLEMTRTTARPQAPAAQGYAVHPWADVLQPEPEHDAGLMAPAGQLWSTATDLARLGAFLLGDTADVLDPETVEEMATPISGDDSQSGWSSYGLGVQLIRSEGVTYAGHGGSMPGFLAGLWVDREERSAGLTFANTTSGPDNQLAFRLLKALRKAEPRIVEPWTPQEPPIGLDLLGTWYWGPAPHLLTATSDGLVLLEGMKRRSRASRFRPGPDGTWIGLDGYYAGETLRICPTHLDLGTFILTRAPYDPAAPIPGGVPESGWTTQA